MRGAAAFARLFRSGRRLDGQHVQILMSPAAGAIGCVGYVIGKKHLARAVDRNYLRRMLREAIRLRRPALDSVDVVVRLKRGCEPGLLRGLACEAAGLLDRLAANDAR
jgi:ribonuclease P protein component